MRNAIRLLPATTLLLIFSVSCSRSRAANDRAAPEAMVPVAVAKAAVEPLAREIVITGEFRPYQVVDIHAKVAGYMKRIYVDVGDRVKSGQLLAVLEIPEMKDDLARAAAERRRSSAELMRARGELARALANQNLVTLSWSRLVSVNKTETGLVAQQEIDEALARKRAADAQVEAAKAALAAAEQQIEISKASEQKIKTLSEYSRITAPFAGWIIRRFADTGAMIQAGTASQTQAMPVVRLAQIDRLRMTIPVPESAVPQIRIGRPVCIRVSSLGKTLTGTISRFTGDVQTATRTMDVEADVPNPGGILMPGMYADAILTLQRNERAVTIPVQALTAREGKQFVMAVSPQGLIEEREIQAGIETAAKIEVVKGVEPEEMVVVGNRGQLRNGEKVEPRLVEAR
jgi:RND family efflux transporter MFP subunit